MAISELFSTVVIILLKIFKMSLDTSGKLSKTNPKRTKNTMAFAVACSSEAGD